jgi:hypothetical protein
MLGIRTNQVFEIYHQGEQLRMVFFMGKDGNPKAGFIGPKSFDIQRVDLTEELRKDLGFHERKREPRKINKLSRRSTPKVRKEINGNKWPDEHEKST